MSPQKVWCYILGAVDTECNKRRGEAPLLSESLRCRCSPSHVMAWSLACNSSLCAYIHVRVEWTERGNSVIMVFQRYGRSFWQRSGIFLLTAVITSTYPFNRWQLIYRVLYYMPSTRKLIVISAVLSGLIYKCSKTAVTNRWSPRKFW
jgi:hypothetical protein